MYQCVAIAPYVLLASHHNAAGSHAEGRCHAGIIIFLRPPVAMITFLFPWWFSLLDSISLSAAR